MQEKYKEIKSEKKRAWLGDSLWMSQVIFHLHHTFHVGMEPSASGLNQEAGRHTQSSPSQSHTHTHTPFTHTWRHSGAPGQPDKQVVALHPNLEPPREAIVSRSRESKTAQTWENITLAMPTANFIHVFQRKIDPLDVFIPDGAPADHHHLWLLFTHGLLRRATGELRPQTWEWVGGSMMFVFLLLQ